MSTDLLLKKAILSILEHARAAVPTPTLIGKVLKRYPSTKRSHVEAVLGHLEMTDEVIAEWKSGWSSMRYKKGSVR